MCWFCYEEMGKPKIINKKTRTAAKLIEKVYDFCNSGGNLHAIIDDFNIDDHYFKQYELIIPDISFKQKRAEIECFFYLKRLTKAERMSALAMTENWFL